MDTVEKRFLSMDWILEYLKLTDSNVYKAIQLGISIAQSSRRKLLYQLVSKSQNHTDHLIDTLTDKWHSLPNGKTAEPNIPVEKQSTGKAGKTYFEIASIKIFSQTRQAKELGELNVKSNRKSGEDRLTYIQMLCGIKSTCAIPLTHEWITNFILVLESWFAEKSISFSKKRNRILRMTRWEDIAYSVYITEFQKLRMREVDLELATPKESLNQNSLAERALKATVEYLNESWRLGKELLPRRTELNGGYTERKNGEFLNDGDVTPLRSDFTDSLRDVFTEEIARSPAEFTIDETKTRILAVAGHLEKIVESQT